MRKKDIKTDSIIVEVRNKYFCVGRGRSGVLTTVLLWSLKRQNALINRKSQSMLLVPAVVETIGAIIGSLGEEAGGGRVEWWWRFC